MYVFFKFLDLLFRKLPPVVLVVAMLVRLVLGLVLEDVQHVLLFLLKFHVLGVDPGGRGRGMVRPWGKLLCLLGRSGPDGLGRFLSRKLLLDTDPSDRIEALLGEHE